MIDDESESVKDFWARMDYLRGDLSIKKFCNQHGISESTYSVTKSRGSKPKEKTIKEWSSKIGCNPLWLQSGSGQPYVSDSHTFVSGGTHSDFADLDYDTLVSAIETIEIYLSDNELTLDSSNKAKAIASVYAIFISDMNKDQAAQSINSLLSLG